MLRRFPIGLADLDGRWYAVSMLGECAWTRNVQAAGGEAVLRHGKAHRVRLVPVPAADRPAIIKTYLAQVPGGRPHIHVPYTAPVEDFVPVAAQVPVYAVEGLRPPG